MLDFLAELPLHAHVTHSIIPSTLGGVKNQDPKDPAYDCPLREFPYSFPLAAVGWSGGVME